MLSLASATAKYLESERKAYDVAGHRDKEQGASSEQDCTLSDDPQRYRSPFLESPLQECERDKKCPEPDEEADNSTGGPGEGAARPLQC